MEAPDGNHYPCAPKHRTSRGSGQEQIVGRPLEKGVGTGPGRAKKPWWNLRYTTAVTLSPFEQYVLLKWLERDDLSSLRANAGISSAVQNLIRDLAEELNITEEQFLEDEEAVRKYTPSIPPGKGRDSST
jgi:hypothetical protein